MTLPTSSTWSPLRSRSLRPVGMSSAMWKGKSTVKVEPLPSSLSTEISPPFISARRLQIARPSPVPPKRRVVEDSAWVKAWNSFAWLALEMPMPWSITRKRHPNLAGLPGATNGSARIATSLPSENLTALPPRLNSTCRRRVGSPLHMRPAGLGSTNTWMRTPFLVAVGVGGGRDARPHRQVTSSPARGFELSGLDLGEIEDVVDDGDECGCRIADARTMGCVIHRRAGSAPGARPCR